ncbi:MAG TPA: sigma-54 dependent transcriptional regulator [Candidatus Hydrogenedentes bacterium]|nr:sigma-54-dependent Fis family transcriptional regulator [Candidatus Hydrogenedentota bacterium]MDY0033313.1 sigma-54 dependent transcriptional regulator [FCB group bacterium]NLT61061.1 sigma-54-dependent Fis family transcriptional regulator [Candidatus Hydrogenedentota bacterium]HNV22127.1 sigma-54 dependent transcriptional regulator [Candidatus Hydrogenedentota bacterium]HNZ18878.1 sigma-54 dependent transcriptional regulator [Candidatus Hydrogenedentota bacterium]
MTRTETKARMLVVDDEPGIRQVLETAFTDRGLAVTTASNGDKAIELLTEQQFDVVITDLKMPGRDGMAVLRAAKEAAIDAGIIVITAYGTLETAVEAMRLGAFDYIAKPFKLQEIELKVDKILGRRKESGPPRDKAAELPDARKIIGDSRSTRQLLKMIEKIGPSRSSVLITGPSGTGKELVARAIHEASPRRDRPFLALNCAALAPGVLESELFGHERGAFTGATGQRAGRFEQAHTGTLFLDEVAEIDPSIQTKLLRVLQEGEFERVGGQQTMKVDVRIVAATNRDLREAIEKGDFREDFYYRLNVFSLRTEPLKRRRDDIPSLVDVFLARFSAETGKNVTGVEDEVMSFFMRYPWPGNIRELENMLERAVVLCEGSVITVEELPQELFFIQEDDEPEPAETPEHGSLVERTDKLESEMIQAALERFRWNKTKAAEHLGLKRTTLQYKIKKYGLE